MGTPVAAASHTAQWYGEVGGLLCNIGRITPSKVACPSLRQILPWSLRLLHRFYSNLLVIIQSNPPLPPTHPNMEVSAIAAAMHIPPLHQRSPTVHSASTP